MSEDDALEASAISAALRGQVFGNRVLVFAEVLSTNETAFGLAPENAPGLVVLAEHQTAGRGQHGRRWESAPRKGLWLSIFLRPGVSLEDAPRLTSLAAETIAQTANQHFSLGATVKPPNDVYADGRKIAGVLLERRALAGSAHTAILGLGMNLNQAAEDFPVELRSQAASIFMLTGKRVARQEFAIALLQNLERAFAT